MSAKTSVTFKVRSKSSSKEEKAKVKKLLDAIGLSKAKLAADRDELRDVYDRLHDLLEYLDYGVEEIDSGMDRIQSGIDVISQTI